MRGRAVLLGGLAAALLVSACDEASPEADPSPSISPTDSVPPAPPGTPAPAPAPDPLVVITHATRPQLRLSRDEAEAVVVRRGTGAVLSSVRAVERDPDAVGVVPLREVGPTVVAALVDGADPVRGHEGATKLVVAGDLMLVRDVPDPAAALAPMRRLLRGADLTVGNLENTLSLDGERALRQTVGTLQQSRIRPFGAGDDVAEAAEPAMLEADGTTYAFLGFNAIGETPAAGPGTPGALSVRMPPRTGPLVEADLARVERAIRKATRQADVVVVLPHWGTQYTHVPEPVQRTVVRRLVAAGADLVVGGHPHWVQGIDVMRGVPVLHSLGNFVFDMDEIPAPGGGFMTQTMEGVVLEATFWGPELKAIRLLPYRMDAGRAAPRRAGCPAPTCSPTSGRPAPARSRDSRRRSAPALRGDSVRNVCDYPRGG